MPGHVLLPDAQSFPGPGKVVEYGDGYRARGVFPGVAVIAPPAGDSAWPLALEHLRRTATPLIETIAPEELRLQRVRLVPLLAINDGGVISPVSGMVSPMRSDDGIRGGMWLTPFYYPHAELVYHECVHLHALEGRLDPAVTELFAGDELDELDRHHPGLADYRPGERPEERLAFWTGRLCSRLDRAAAQDQAVLDHPLPVATSLSPGVDASGWTEAGDLGWIPRHSSLQHSRFRQFLTDFRSGVVGRRPADADRRQLALRDHGYSGTDDPRLLDLPRYSTGRSTTAVADRAAHTARAAEPRPATQEVAMDATTSNAAATTSPGRIAVSGWNPGAALRISDAPVRKALRPVLDLWWLRHQDEVMALDPALQSADALISDPSAGRDAALARLRDRLLSAVASATGAERIVLPAAVRGVWTAPRADEWLVGAVPAETWPLETGPHAVGEDDSGADRLQPMALLATEGSAASLDGRPGWTWDFSDAESAGKAIASLDGIEDLDAVVAQGGGPSAWTLGRTRWAVDLTCDAIPGSAAAFAALARARASLDGDLPAITVVHRRGEGSASLDAAILVETRGEAERLSRHFAGCGPWTVDGHRLNQSKLCKPQDLEGRLDRVGGLALAVQGGVLAAASSATLDHLQPPPPGAASLAAKLSSLHLPADASERLQDLPGRALSDVGTRLDHDLAEAARQLLELHPTLPSGTSAELGRLAARAAEGSDPHGALTVAGDTASAVREALAALPADAAATARDTLAAYIDAITLLRGTAADVAGATPAGNAALDRIGDLQAFGLEAGLPVTADPATWSTAHDMADPAGAASPGMLHGVSSVVHTALDGVGHQAAQAIGDVVIQGAHLLEPVGRAFEAVAHAGQGVLYSARSGGPADDPPQVPATSPTSVTRLDDHRVEPVGRSEDRLIRQQASALAAAMEFVDRREAAGELERHLVAAGLERPIVDTLLRPLGRLPDADTGAGLPADPAALDLLRHATELARSDIVEGVPARSEGQPSSSQHHPTRSQGATPGAGAAVGGGGGDRTVSLRAAGELRAQVERAERQQARRDLAQMARDAGLGTEAVHGIKPTQAGFLRQADPRLAAAVTAATAKGSAPAMRLAARDAGAAGPFWVIGDPAARRAVSDALAHLAGDRRLSSIVEGASPGRIERARELLASGTAGGVPAGVLPAAETRTALLAAASRLAARRDSSVERALQPLLETSARQWTPPPPRRPPSPSNARPGGQER